MRDHAKALASATRPPYHTVRNGCGGKEMPEAKVTSKGQVTIPKEIRDKLRLKTGDRLLFTADEVGEVRLTALNRSLLDLVGCLKSKVTRTTPVTLEEMDEAIQDSAVARFKRSW